VRFVDLLVPALCAICGQPGMRGDPLCEACTNGLARTGPVSASVPGIDHCWAAGAHEGVIRELVTALKFKRRLPLAAVAAERLARSLPVSLSGPLVPVPPSPSRNRLRGFDSATAIAAELGRLTDAPVLDLLDRTDRGRQVGRRRSERLADPPRIEATGRAPVAATLVDDVVTTGATLSACAAVLRLAGCREILAIAFARA
jgi:predicted amidophosphoribosyltransferase